VWESGGGGGRFGSQFNFTFEIRKIPDFISVLLSLWFSNFTASIFSTSISLFQKLNFFLVPISFSLTLISLLRQILS
jgi:hypothetical protein